MSTINPVNSAFYTPPVASPSTATTSSSTAKPEVFQDAVDLSLAGRIALGVNDGRLSSDQAQELTSQLSTLNQQVQSGGPGVSNLRSLLSQQIYSDAHNGASMPANLTATSSEMRDFVQAGRVAKQESEGNLSSTQASDFLAQIGQKLGLET
ncbi:MAG TPA: hypothetical protein VK708_13650 [Bryobacteraceae bacterium]|jgi:hypothetical protein|nr:hypothetical protein [Bryobacteraceae bacterium]